ncbi:hypothetical protein [Schumannella soli]|uniref:Uncharacterized protein n=1 Tax=Schumannella soli TaxID=2590779 RepID=A0A506Y0U6_9MICO|nr:hypothetical protein [Schumannella soli]TPW76156.1 hypothetical protein FJ657_10115 [Schumannella soli]
MFRAPENSWSLDGPDDTIPVPKYAAPSPSPNVIVVCSPGDTGDLALLWTLRAAHGDHFALPIGIPAAEFTKDVLAYIRQQVTEDHPGWPQALYVTSTSVPITELAAQTPDSAPSPIHFEFVAPRQVMTLGRAPGWNRDEVLLWHEGAATFVPFTDRRVQRQREQGGFSPRALFEVDVRLPADPLPNPLDVRTRAPNVRYAAGAVTHRATLSGDEPIEIAWPSKMLMLRTVLDARGLDAEPSEPGTACVTALSDFRNYWEIGNLAHEPLLRLLDDMASQNSAAWAKRQTRTPRDQRLSGEVPASVDDLAERSYEKFKERLGNNTRATNEWLNWAERSGVVIRGFSTRCLHCQSKQWIPVSAFALPLICRGCGKPMEYPFENPNLVKFSYRLSERMRRVYEHDAMGHLPALRYFAVLYFVGGGRVDIIGLHPGMNVREARGGNGVGEIDLTMLFPNGNVVPVEAKRSAGAVGGYGDCKARSNRSAPRRFLVRLRRLRLCQGR